MSRYGELRAEFEDGATPGGISTKSFIFRYFDLYVRLFFFSRPVGKLHDESGDGIAQGATQHGAGAPAHLRPHPAGTTRRIYRGGFTDFIYGVIRDNFCAGLPPPLG